MEYLGRGLGTLGVWGGVALISTNVVSAGEYAIGAFVVLFVAACIATVAVWYSS